MEKVKARCRGEEMIGGTTGIRISPEKKSSFGGEKDLRAYP